MSSAVCVAEDRSLLVHRGQVVKTGYVDIFKVRLANRTPMSAGDMQLAHQRAVNLGDASAFPPPNGYWDGDVFVVKDGRHEWLASVMRGRDQILVAWIEDEKEHTCSTR